MYKSFCEEGRKFGYIVNGAKSWSIVKTSELTESAKKVFGDDVNITLEGRRHLGAVIGSKEFKDQYCQEKVDKWLRKMESLTEISKSQSHAAYAAGKRQGSQLVAERYSNRRTRTGFEQAGV